MPSEAPSGGGQVRLPPAGRMTFGTAVRDGSGAQCVPERRTPLPTQTNEVRPDMNTNRRSHREDVLFVLALLVPAFFAGARYVQSDHEMALIAQAAQVQVAQALHTPQIRKS